MFTHVLLEVYCGFVHGGVADNTENPSIKECNYTPSYHCLFEKCPYVAFTSCKNAACYVDERSEAEDLIAFGGEMEENIDEVAIPEAIELWKRISKEKIGEAYDEYMKMKGQKYN